MKSFKYEAAGDCGHFAICNILSVTWVGSLWVVKLSKLEFFGIGWRRMSFRILKRSAACE